MDNTEEKKNNDLPPATAEQIAEFLEEEVKRMSEAEPEKKEEKKGK